MNRIDAKFRELRKKGRKAFIAFITCGYPDMTTTEKLVLELEARGVDILELGVPFSDPLADGAVIQEASFQALQKKTYLPGILKMVRKLRRKANLPIALMTYYNPIFCFGEKKFVDAAVASGVDGVIIPDLPPEEAKVFLDYAKARGLANICFIAPTSSPKRVKFISRISQGFIYYVCLTGVTGARKSLPADLKENIARIKKQTSKPVCVGFGISTASQVRSVKRICDGAIVGSAIVKKIKEHIKDKRLVKRVGNFVGKLNV